MLAIEVHAVLELYCAWAPLHTPARPMAQTWVTFTQGAKERSLAVPATTDKLLAISLSLDSLVIY